MNQIAVDLMIKDLEFEEALAWAIASYGRGISVIKGNDERNIPEQHTILLTDCMDKADDFLKLHSDIPVLYFAECEEQLMSLKASGVPATHKYQSIIQTLSEISLLAAEKLNITIGSYKKAGSTKIITFFGAGGGVGTTTLALATAQYLKRYRSANCLYVSFETWESTGIYMNQSEGNRGIEEFLYCIREGKKTAESISSFTCRDNYGVDAFATSDGMNPLSRLSGDETVDFINRLIHYEGYDYILIDAASDFSEAAVRAMENSSCNVFISDTTEVGTKERHAMAYLEQNTSVNVEKDFIRIVNRSKDVGYMNFEVSGEQHESDKKLKQHIIFEDTEGFDCIDGKGSINLDREFGVCISEFAQKL